MSKLLEVRGGNIIILTAGAGGPLNPMHSKDRDVVRQ